VIDRGIQLLFFFVDCLLIFISPAPLRPEHQARGTGKDKAADQQVEDDILKCSKRSSFDDRGAQ
jgi:hypothetical protein